MSKRFLTTGPNGELAITELAGPGLRATPLSTEETAALEGWQFAKTLFELSRTTDMASHFDPALHTLAAIAAGLPGHRALSLLAEVDDTDLPADSYFRDAWEWID